MLSIAIAAWGGIVPFVGPTFDFDLGGTHTAWVWNQSHAIQHAWPGVAGIVGGLLMLSTIPWALERIGALLVLASGAWFAIGPTLEPLWTQQGASTSALDGTNGSTTLRVLEGIGYHYGTGVALVMLGAFALGLLALAPAAVAATEERPAGARRPIFSFRHARHA